VAVVCDAEIYNGREIAPPDAAWPLGEAALIAALFNRRGAEWWRDVRGPFSAFIWDKAARRGYAFGDRIGARPLVYREDAGRIAIATRIRSLAALPGFRKTVDPQAIYSYMAMEMIPVPFSVFEGVKKLESGRYLDIRNGAAEIAVGWDMAYAREKNRSEEDLKRRAYALLKESVSLQSSYGVDPDRVGCFLSGGTDSSSIAGLMNELKPGQTRSFSIGFDESGFDEMHYARIASKAFGTRHTEYYVKPEDVLAAMPLIARAYDEPFANSSAIPTYFCAKVAKEHGVDVMLGGDGGDEIFGGNSRYREISLAPKNGPLEIPKQAVAAALSALPRALRPALAERLRYRLAPAKMPLHERIHRYSLYKYLPPSGIFTRDFLGSHPLVDPQAISKGYLDRVAAQPPLDQYLYHDLKITLMDNDLPKVGQMTDLAGVTVRYPFLDHALVEFTGTIPPEWKIKDGRLRYLFKDAMKGLLPEEIINKTKHGFGIPVARWLVRDGTPLHEALREALFGGTLARRGIFRESFLKTLYEKARSDRADFFGVYVYYIFFLETWFREHLD
jgi:asparagine synthase (glutamine-hydrolysing)